MISSLDTVLQNCEVPNFFTGENKRMDIGIVGERIQCMAEPFTCQGAEEIDCTGLIAMPGFMDAHFHTESTLLSLPELAEVLLQKGTTAIFVNPHEIANVAGLEGIRRLLEDSDQIPLRVYIVAPIKVPTVPGLEKSAAEFGLDEVETMLSWPSVVGIGEFDAYKLMYPREPYQSMIQMAREKGIAICGSVNGIRGEQLVDCIASGITDDHESVDGQEAYEKLQNGLFLHVREGSTERNLEEIIRMIKNFPAGLSQLCFCSDDKHPDDLWHEGHMDHNIRKSIDLGLDPLWAYRIASYNTACYYKLEHKLGLLAPGKIADIVMVSDLNQVDVQNVFVAGKQVVAEGESIWEAPASRSQWGKDTINWPQQLTPEALQLKTNTNRDEVLVRTAEVQPDQIISRIKTEMLLQKDGAVAADPRKDVAYFILAERYRGENILVKGFVKGFQLERGALASSVAHDHHHLVAVGTNLADIAKALNHIAGMGGGLVVVDQGKVIADLPLPIAGLLSEKTLKEVVEESTQLKNAAKQLGSTLPNPFLTLALLPLPVIPEAGFTDQGMVDVRQQKIISVIVEE